MTGCLQAINELYQLKVDSATTCIQISIGFELRLDG